MCKCWFHKTIQCIIYSCPLKYFVSNTFRVVGQPFCHLSFYRLHSHQITPTTEVTLNYKSGVVTVSILFPCVFSFFLSFIVFPFLPFHALCWFIHLNFIFRRIIAWTLYVYVGILSAGVCLNAYGSLATCASLNFVNTLTFISYFQMRIGRLDTVLCAGWETEVSVCSLVIGHSLCRFGSVMCVCVDVFAEFLLTKLFVFFFFNLL